MANERSSDLVLNGGEYAFIQDLTKGVVNVYVGPTKVSLAGTDSAVKFDGKKFVPCTNLNDAITGFPVAPEGSYIVLQNPAKNGSDKEHPPVGSTAAIDLNWGRTVNIPGPVRFPLWPGQSTQVVEGHKLRTNQYLVAVVTNGDEAAKNWPTAVVLGSPPVVATKPAAAAAATGRPAAGSEVPGESDKSRQGEGAGGAPSSPPSGTPPAVGEVQAAPAVAVQAKRLVTGQRIVIRGTEVSFFIPPTGVEVQPEGSGGKYVREAVSLESLQYCVLRSESGKKRYVKGPAVVFPEPDEEFVQLESERVFKAFVLNPQMGIHVSVVEPYNDSDKPVDDPEKADHKKGEELFITGDSQGVYYPRAEHVIIKYRNEQVHFAVVIPAGEGRYVLSKTTGNVQLVQGPKMLLCDPREQVIVLRPLSETEASLWFPNSKAAAEVNATLREAGSRSGYLTEESFAAASRGGDEGRFIGPSVSRRSAFTEPKSITLDTKYKGAVGVNVWPGYAVQVVSKSGERKTVIGPANILLGYDETLAPLELTTGTPKDEHKQKLRTVYLRVTGNRVSDKVQAETADMVGVTTTVSYRVNFIAEKSKSWFNLEDYVGFLVDHLRSLIRNAVKQHGIEEFNKDSVSILRDAVLGSPGDKEAKKRTGKSFDENGMHVYDLEVLDVQIGDKAIDDLLRGAEKEAVRAALDLEARRRTLTLTKETEAVARETAKEKTATAIDEMKHAIDKAMQKLDVEEAEREVRLAAERAELEARKKNQDALDEIAERELARSRKVADQANALAKAKQALEIALLEKKTAADVERFKALTPDLISALQAFGDKDLAARLATVLRTVPMGIDEGMGEAIERVFKGTILADAVSKHGAGSNGNATAVPESLRR